MVVRDYTISEKSYIIPTFEKRLPDFIQTALFVNSNLFKFLPFRNNIND
jgi:hypothetical protein